MDASISILILKEQESPQTTTHSLEEPAQLSPDQDRGSGVVGHRTANQKPCGDTTSSLGRDRRGLEITERKTLFCLWGKQRLLSPRN